MNFDNTDVVFREKYLFYVKMNVPRRPRGELDIHFFYKQPVYNQLALRWQIAKQFSELNPLSLRNNNNCRLKKSGVFLCNKCKIALKPTIHQNSTFSKASLGKF